MRGDTAVNFCEDLLITVGGKWEGIWGDIRATGLRVRGHDKDLRS